MERNRIDYDSAVSTNIDAAVRLPIHRSPTFVRPRRQLAIAPKLFVVDLPFLPSSGFSFSTRLSFLSPVESARRRSQPPSRPRKRSATAEAQFVATCPCRCRRFCPVVAVELQSAARLTIWILRSFAASRQIYAVE
ncbi:unnamed protein product [Citrullus colocynthis]|uniref:Uncharacterized protein n=1 Tax=Citrullus colocynthis TaxID=252529 RepID=A0ABP0YHB7_9ROSI